MDSDGKRCKIILTTVSDNEVDFPSPVESYNEIPRSHSPRSQSNEELNIPVSLSLKCKNCKSAGMAHKTHCLL
jgi:hypothetical protein